MSTTRSQKKKRERIVTSTQVHSISVTQVSHPSPNHPQIPCGNPTGLVADKNGSQKDANQDIMMVIILLKKLKH